MYGRGARVLTQPTLSTAPGVGPGTYRVENGGKHTGGIASELSHNEITTLA